VSNPPPLSTDLREQVRQRANYLCEYCHTSERWQYVRFTLDHIVPALEGGGEDLENLALACFHCNRRKSNNQTANDPETSTVVSLFNPRLHRWSEHFTWSGDGLYVMPLTATGRATLVLLSLTANALWKFRRADVEVRRHPPEGDPVNR